MALFKNSDKITVTCGELTGSLLLKKFFCPAIHRACIECDKGVITPNQFCVMADKQKLKDWKSAIRFEGVPLRKYIESGQLDFYRHNEFCTGRCTARTPINRSSNISSIGLEANAATLTFNPKQMTEDVMTDYDQKTTNADEQSGTNITDTLYRRLVYPGPVVDSSEDDSGEEKDVECFESEKKPTLTGSSKLTSAAKVKSSTLKSSYSSFSSGISSSSGQKTATSTSALPSEADTQQLQPVITRNNSFDSDGVEIITVTSAQLSDDQQFWLGIVEQNLSDAVFQEIHMALNSMKRDLITYCVREEDAYCLSNIVRDLGLMTNLKAKLATIKAHMDQQQEHLENEMQELKKKVAEYEAQREALKRKSDKFEYLIEATAAKKRRQMRVVQDVAESSLLNSVSEDSDEDSSENGVVTPRKQLAGVSGKQVGSLIESGVSVWDSHPCTVLSQSIKTDFDHSSQETENIPVCKSNVESKQDSASVSDFVDSNAGSIPTSLKQRHKANIFTPNRIDRHTNKIGKHINRINRHNKTESGSVTKSSCTQRGVGIKKMKSYKENGFNEQIRISDTKIKILKPLKSEGSKLYKNKILKGSDNDEFSMDESVYSNSTQASANLLAGKRIYMPDDTVPSKSNPVFSSPCALSSMQTDIENVCIEQRKEEPGASTLAVYNQKNSSSVSLLSAGIDVMVKTNVTNDLPFSETNSISSNTNDTKFENETVTLSESGASRTAKIKDGLDRMKTLDIKPEKNNDISLSDLGKDVETKDGLERMETLIIKPEKNNDISLSDLGKGVETKDGLERMETLIIKPEKNKGSSLSELCKTRLELKQIEDTVEINGALNRTEKSLLEFEHFDYDLQNNCDYVGIKPTFIDGQTANNDQVGITESTFSEQVETANRDQIGIAKSAVIEEIHTANNDLVEKFQTVAEKHLASYNTQIVLTKSSVHENGQTPQNEQVGMTECTITEVVQTVQNDQVAMTMPILTEENQTAKVTSSNHTWSKNDIIFGSVNIGQRQLVSDSNHGENLSELDSVDFYSKRSHVQASIPLAENNKHSKETAVCSNLPEPSLNCVLNSSVVSDLTFSPTGEIKAYKVDNLTSLFCNESDLEHDQIKNDQISFNEMGNNVVIEDPVTSMAPKQIVKAKAAKGREQIIGTVVSTNSEEMVEPNTLEDGELAQITNRETLVELFTCTAGEQAVETETSIAEEQLTETETSVAGEHLAETEISLVREHVTGTSIAGEQFAETETSVTREQLSEMETSVAREHLAETEASVTREQSSEMETSVAREHLAETEASATGEDLAETLAYKAIEHVYGVDEIQVVNEKTSNKATLVEAITCEAKGCINTVTSTEADPLAKAMKFEVGTVISEDEFKTMTIKIGTITSEDEVKAMTFEVGTGTCKDKIKIKKSEVGKMAHKNEIKVMTFGVGEDEVQAMTPEVRTVTSKDEVKTMAYEVGTGTCKDETKAINSEVGAETSKCEVKVMLSEIGTVTSKDLVKTIISEVGTVASKDIVKSLTPEIGTVISKDLVKAVTPEAGTLTSKVVVKEMTAEVGTVMSKDIVKAATPEFGRMTPEAVVEGLTSEVGTLKSKEIVNEMISEVGPVLSKDTFKTGQMVITVTSAVNCNLELEKTQNAKTVSLPFDTKFADPVHQISADCSTKKIFLVPTAASDKCEANLSIHSLKDRGPLNKMMHVTSSQLESVNQAVSANPVRLAESPDSKQMFYMLNVNKPLSLTSAESLQTNTNALNPEANENSKLRFVKILPSDSKVMTPEVNIVKVVSFQELLKMTSATKKNHVEDVAVSSQIKSAFKNKPMNPKNIVMNSRKKPMNSKNKAMQTSEKTTLPYQWVCSSGKTNSTPRLQVLTIQAPSNKTHGNKKTASDFHTGNASVQQVNCKDFDMKSNGCKTVSVGVGTSSYNGTEIVRATFTNRSALVKPNKSTSSNTDPMLLTTSSNAGPKLISHNLSSTGLMKSKVSELMEKRSKQVKAIKLLPNSLKRETVKESSCRKRYSPSNSSLECVGGKSIPVKRAKCVVRSGKHEEESITDDNMANMQSKSLQQLTSDRFSDVCIKAIKLCDKLPVRSVVTEQKHSSITVLKSVPEMSNSGEYRDLAKQESSQKVLVEHFAVINPKDSEKPANVLAQKSFPEEPLALQDEASFSTRRSARRQPQLPAKYRSDQFLLPRKYVSTDNSNSYEDIDKLNGERLNCRK